MKRRAVISAALLLAAHGLVPRALARTDAASRPREGGDPAAPLPYPARPEVRAWIDAAVAEHGFERADLERWLGQARYSPTTERLMQPAIPFGQRNWLDYRVRYLDDKRIRDGVAFWRQHGAALARAQQQFGVPPEVIVAIIGVETLYGRNTGNFRTLDVLATLSFDYLRRADYYRGELAQFLLLAREQRVDPLAVRGSFAGAIGLPQFMPGSIRRYAVDWDGDSRIDLAASPADAIGSVASFLAQHGWQRDAPVVFAARTDEATVDLLGRGIAANVAWKDAAALDVQIDGTLDPEEPVIVIDLPVVAADGSAARQYRVGTRSFAAVLNYNRSYFYATAVCELAAAIAAAAAAGTASPRR